MAMMRKCDFQDCSNEGDSIVELRRDTIGYQADLCTDHIAVIMETMTFRPVVSTSYGKARDVYTGASGAPFSAADARAWLVEKGIKSGAATGRVSKEHLDLYASSH